MARLIIHATNIHQGGGAILLVELLRTIPSRVDAIATIDARLVLTDDIPAHILINRVAPSFYGRLSAELELAGKAKSEDWILCFGNLPPLFRVMGDVSVFLQNRYLVERLSLSALLPIKQRLRLFVEWFWLRMLRNRARRYFVQTSSMMRLAEERLGVKVICAPIVPDNILNQAVPEVARTLLFDFIYVASGEPHKNHKTLIRAWTILAAEGLYPSLALTLASDDSPELTALIATECASNGLRIHNLGKLPYNKLDAIYRESGALIYPSLFESFGLPLVEARSLGLSVLASELDYVRDITDPEETFDPQSPLSIARAVKRHMKKSNSLPKMHTLREFLDQITQRSVL